MKRHSRLMPLTRGFNVLVLILLCATTSKSLSAQSMDLFGPAAHERHLQRLIAQMPRETQEELAVQLLAVKQNPNNVDALIRSGVIFMRQAEHTAINREWLLYSTILLQRAVQVAPSNFYARHNYAQVLLMTGDLRPELRAMAARQNPKLAGQPNSELAVKEFTEAIRLNPGSARSYMGRGFAYLMLDDQPRAQPDLDKAIALDPTLRPNVEIEVKAIREMKARSRHEIDDTRQMLRQMGSYGVFTGVHKEEDCKELKGYWVNNECRSKALLPSQ